MSLNIKELRIGNIIRHNVKDDETGGFTEPNEDVITEDDMMYFLAMDEIESELVPITEEWLKRFGFKEDKKHKSYYHSALSREFGKGNNIPFLSFYFVNVQEVEKKYCYVFNRGIGEHIKHIHQLQNLYFALTGTELTIKP